jgi:hypothetical protein
MKSSLHSLIPFTTLFSITFDCQLYQFSAAIANFRTRLNSHSSCVRLGADPEKNTASSTVAHSLLWTCVYHTVAQQQAQPDPQRTPLATSLLLLCDVIAHMTHSSTACVQAIIWQRLFLCLESSCFKQICHTLLPQ